MEYKYSTIKLSEKFSQYKGEDGSSLNEISGLSSINIIVGSNNSGKSRFLRELIKIKDFEFKTSASGLDAINKELADIQLRLSILAQKHEGILSFKAGNSTLRPDLLRVTLDSEFMSNKFFSERPLSGILNLLSTLKNNKYAIDTSRGSNDVSSYEGDVKTLIGSKTSLIELLKRPSLEEIKFKKIYIPILRSLNYFGFSDANRESEEQDIYRHRVSKKYQLDEDSLNLNIFTGLNLYNTIKGMLLGDADQRKRIAKYEEFLSAKLFGGKEVSLIPKEKDDVLHVKIGEEEYAIYNLGDGIQSLIILTFPLFEVENGLFFIEEPEIHLHPDLQRKLIEVLKEMKNHQYFITTHSNHFLDLTLDYVDTSIYTFKKQGESTIVKLVSSGDENILQLLGARNSSVFLSNCTIWVEGITDRLYIRKYLDFYQRNKEQKIQEDIDYSFVEYGGGNITHWSFLDKEEYPINIDRLCGKSFLITDKDGDKKIERKEELKNELGDRYKLLECNEIENTLSLKTIERVLRVYEKGSSFVMPAFRSEDVHKDKKIGEFIEDKIFAEQTMFRKGGYKTDSGSIKSKVDFCKKAIDGMTEEEVSPLAHSLAEDIYNFVLGNKET